MTNFAYNLNIPAAGNNPSNDQGLMQTNTNSLINVDHYSFMQAGGGLHRQVTLPTETIPTVTIGQAAMYSKTAGQTQLFATTDNGGNEYQLTRFIDAQIATFGIYGTFGTVTANYSINGFWTFLPGGLIFMNGIVQSTTATPQISPSTIVVTFPFNFTSNNIIVTITPICKAGGTSVNDVAASTNGSTSKSGFTCNFTSSTSAYTGFTWTAIGI